MPFTTLSLTDIELIEKIITFQIGDLWVRVYDLGESSQLSSLQLNQVKSLGEELLSAEVYAVYSSTTLNLNAE